MILILDNSDLHPKQQQRPFSELNVWSVPHSMKTISRANLVAIVRGHESLVVKDRTGGATGIVATTQLLRLVKQAIMPEG